MTRTVRIAALVALAYAALLLQLPLLNYLGFEFSVATALIVPWIAGALVFSRHRLRTGAAAAAMSGVPPPAGRPQRVRGLLLTSGGLLLIPFAAATVNALFVKNCSYLEGVCFFLLIPVVTAVWSLAFALFCARSVRRRAGTVYTLVTIAILLYPLYLGYFSPPIYSYNLIYGFFPGFSYDESLSITPTLLLFRGVTLLAAFFFLLLSRFVVRERRRAAEEGPAAGAAIRSLERPAEAADTKAGRGEEEGGARIREGDALSPAGRGGGRGSPVGGPRRSPAVHPVSESILLALGLLLLMGAWIFRQPLGFEASAAYIQSELGTVYITEHFRIYYSPASFSREEMAWVGLQHEFRYDQVTRALNVHPAGRIHSYLYPDGGVKRRLIGTFSTNIAKPWRREIHLSKDSWQQTLKHELVHVLAGEFGMPVIHAHYNIGLVEGLAMAVEGDVGNRTLHQYAAAVRVFGLVNRPEQLIRPVGFAFKASMVSYTLMGSFCKYLIDRHGITHFKELYGGRSVERVYGRSYQELVAEWQEFLTGVAVPQSWRNHVEFYFNRPSIFAKECARRVANLNDEAYRDLDTGNSMAAMNVFSRALLTSWNTESYQGLVRAAYSAARYDTVVTLVDSQMQTSAGRSGILNLFLYYGDALWWRGETLSAGKAYREVLGLDLSDRLNEAAAVRLEALGDQELRESLVPYFAGGRMADSSAALFLDSLEKRLSPSRSPAARRLLPYLKARLFVRMSRYGEAIRALKGGGGAAAAAAQDTLFPLPVLNAGREQILGQSFFRKKQFQLARALFWQSLNYSSNQASRDRVEDWIERCEWFEQKMAK